MNKLPYGREKLLDYIKNFLIDIDIAVEVGTYKGDFGQQIIDKTSPNTFYAVDPLRLFPGMISYPGFEFDSQESLDALAEKVSNRFSNQGHILLRGTSKEQSTTFENESVDFVYIDGDHTYEGCKLDIDLWWPKIKQGGILAGHDFCNSVNSKTGLKFGVIQAVTEFVEKNNLKLYTTNESYASWLVVKGNREFDG